MRVLVTGGAGYIGSHAVRRLLAGGHDVTVLDNLSRGHKAAILPGVEFAQLDLRDVEGVAALLRRREIEAVMHFAAYALVGESVTEPLLYYDNNTWGSTCLLSAMAKAGVDRIVFSSTCATYGEPESMPIVETLPQNPINPYGWSKLFVERILKDFGKANPNFAFAALRYFNVAGCASDGSLGEDHAPETHIIPVVLQTVLGKREKITIFGEDYPTPDGTCIRDYIHVEDLVDAHAVVLEALDDGDQRFYNLGTGQGLSVKQIVDSVRRVTGRDFKVEIGPRRPGDPPMLYADPRKIERELGWKAKITDVDQTVASAWRWFEKHPDGYGDQ